MLVLGIDPGWTNMGLSLIEVHGSSSITLISETTVNTHTYKTSSYTPLSLGINRCMWQWKRNHPDPDQVYIEATGAYSMPLERLTSILHTVVLMVFPRATVLPLAKRTVHAYFNVPIRGHDQNKRALLRKRASLFADARSVNDHEADATMIAITGALYLHQNLVLTEAFQFNVAMPLERVPGVKCSECAEEGLGRLVAQDGRVWLKCSRDYGGCDKFFGEYEVELRKLSAPGGKKPYTAKVPSWVTGLEERLARIEKLLGRKRDRDYDSDATDVLSPKRSKNTNEYGSECE